MNKSHISPIALLPGAHPIPPQVFDLLRDGAESIASLPRVTGLLQAILAETGLGLGQGLGQGVEGGANGQIGAYPFPKSASNPSAVMGCDRLLQEESSWQAACLALTERLLQVRCKHLF